jgi:hypothetical protein
MVYLIKDDNLGIEEWEIYSINRSITPEAETGELSVFTVRIELPRPQLARLLMLIRERSVRINVRDDPVPAYQEKDPIYEIIETLENLDQTLAAARPPCSDL